MQPITDADFVTAPAATYMVDGQVDLARVVWELSRSGWRPLLIDRHTAGDKQRLLEAFSTGLCFPDWFGYNWDALVDLLRQWASYQPLAVVIADMSNGGVDPGVEVSSNAAGDALATLATLTEIIDDLVVDGAQIKLGIVPSA